MYISDSPADSAVHAYTHQPRSRPSGTNGRVSGTPSSLFVHTVSKQCPNTTQLAATDAQVATCIA